MADTKVKFTSDTTGVTQGVAKIHSSIAGLKSSVSSMGSAFKSALGPITAITTLLGGIGIGAGIKDILDFGGTISEFSQSLGIGKDKLVIFQEAFKQSGIEGEKLQMILAKLSSSVSSPDDKLLEWLNKFNIDIKDLQAMGVGDRFETIGRAIGGMASPTDRISASMDIFGKKVGATLIPLFRTRDVMSDASAQVGGLAQSMVRYADSFDYVGDIFGGIGTKIRQVFAGLVGANIDNLIILADRFKSLDLTSFGEGLGDRVRGISDVIVNLMDAFDQGRFVDTVWNGMKFVWAESKAYLVATFRYLGQVLVESIVSNLKSAGLSQKTLDTIFAPVASKAELQKDLDNARNRFDSLMYDKSFGDTVGFSKYTPIQTSIDEAAREIDLLTGMISSYSNKVQPLTFDQILSQERGNAGVGQAWNDFMDPRNTADNSRAIEAGFNFQDEVMAFLEALSEDEAAAMVKPFEDAANRIYDLNEQDMRLSPERGTLLGSLMGDMEYIKTLKDLEEVVSNPYTPVNTSLGRIGGDQGSSYINSFTNNPLVALQQRANAMLQKIVDNTDRITSPAWE